MIKSMTGYGRGEIALSDHSKVTVEIRSLNGKSVDIFLKGNIIPKDKEIGVRKLIIESLVRGSIECTVSRDFTGCGAVRKLNNEVILDYLGQIKELCQSSKEDSHLDAILLSAILRFPDVAERGSGEIAGEDWLLVESAVKEALSGVNAYRAEEGRALYEDILPRVKTIIDYLQKVKEADVKRIPAIRDRIKGKIAECSIAPEENRLEQEIVYYVEKLDINEEEVRLGQHCAYFLQTLESEPLPGKKLGFIAQEMGREINTIGSKANDSVIQELVVRMKDELEKIKEQCMNIL